MSSEDDKKVQEVFIDKLGAKYPYVTVDKKVVRSYGIKFYPSIYCIDAEGNVHSVPADRMPSESVIEDLLKSARVGPPLPEGSQYGALRSMWKKKQYAKISDYLGKMLAQSNLDPDMREVFENQQKLIEKKVASQESKVAKLAQGPDYYAAYESLGKIAKAWKGFPVADQAASEMARFKGDAKIKKEMSSGKALAKLMAKYDRSKRSQARKLEIALNKFANAKKHAGTHAALKARRLLGGG